MAYTVLARRYRSQSFNDVVGQDAIAHTLENAIKSDRVAHAYLFSGTRGVGKTTMARILAKALNCLNSDGPTISPCCECESCKAINTGDDIDVIEIDGASNNGVDNIRDLRQNAMYRPARSRFKIYIIDEIHMLSTGAFNALLKILEEPPSHVKFIFATTEPNKVLPTIQSRCQRFDFRSIDPDSIAKQVVDVLKMENVGCDEDFAVAVSRLANGSMRDALSLLDQLLSTGANPLTLEVLESTLGQPGMGQIVEMVEAIANTDASQVLINADSMLTKGMSPGQIIDSLIDYFRDLMIASTAGLNNSLVIQTSRQKEQTADLVKKFDTASLVYAVTSLEKMRDTVKKSDNPRALLEAVLIRLTLSEHFINVQAIMQQLSSGAMLKKNSSPQLVPQPQAPQPRQSYSRRDEPKPANTASPVEEVALECQNLEQIKAKWSEIVRRISNINQPLSMHISGCEPRGFDGDRITLHAPSTTSLNILKGRMTDAESAFTEILGKNIRVHIGFGEETQTVARPRGAKTSLKEQQDVMSEPGVMEVINAFNAKIISINTSGESQ